MTRDEYREACLKVMKAGFFSEYNQPNPPPGVDICLRAAFDSLHDIARVMPIEATENMQADGDKAIWNYAGAKIIKRVWRAMSTAGDLTNPPEK